MLGLQIPFDKYINYEEIYKDSHITLRSSNINHKNEYQIEHKDDLHYQENYQNR